MSHATSIGDFLYARSLDEDEEASSAVWIVRETRGDLNRPAARADMIRRMLAEHPFPDGRCLTCHRGEGGPAAWDYQRFPCVTIRLLALPYSDHDDWQDEWTLQ